MIKSKKEVKVVKVITKKKTDAKLDTMVIAKTPKMDCNEAKEIIAYLLSKLPEENGKGIDRAKKFIA